VEDTVDRSLEIQIAQALMRWRLVERALHSRQPWSMEYNGVRVPASRFIRDGRVSFVGHFPPMCPLQDPDLIVVLYDGDEMVHCIPLEERLDEDGSQVWWDLLSRPVPVE
jgi:hypothetical protein